MTAGRPVRRIRVLVVDDSAVVRRVFTTVLAEDSDLEMVGTAANGKIALTKLAQVEPDVITLDIEMPEMDGLATLAAIRRTHPHLPVIMVSSLTERGAAVTIEALALGASDYVAKPSQTAGVEETLRCLREVLIPKVRALGGRAAGLPPPPPPVAPRVATPRPPNPTGSAPGAPLIDVVTIGVSTGGPNALATMLSALPGDLPVPVLIVQHMPPLFTRLLAERLTDRCDLPVTEAIEGEAVAAGHVWVAPGNFHLTVVHARGAVRLHTSQEPPENFCRPAVDVLFASVAELYGPHALALVLTGMGQDGLRGCRRIREAGGQIVVQDEASSVVWGMPGYVAGEGLADRVLPLDEIGREIVRRVREGRRLPSRSAPASNLGDGRCP